MGKAFFSFTVGKPIKKKPRRDIFAKGSVVFSKCNFIPRKYCIRVLRHTSKVSEANLGPYQKSMMEVFYENS